MKNASQYYPGMETLGPDEMRVTFMGSSPVPRSNQSGTSIFVELGNGDSFIFDMGPGCVHNYTGLGVPFPKINDIFLTHLHVDHWGEIPYVVMFGANYGRVDPLRVYGPSGRTKDLGTAAWAEHINEALNWHRHSFGQFPTWPGLYIEPRELKWDANPGVAYEKNGVKITHWPIPHSVDGSISLRLDWNGLSFLFAGDGRPTELTIKYGKGVDMLVTECAVANIEVMRAVFAAQSPETLAYGLDVPHTPAYAAGYMFAQAKPRVGVVTHESFDHLVLAELVDEIRYHWDGPIGLGMPDLVVFNITKDAIWQREGVIPVGGGIPPTSRRRRIWPSCGIRSKSLAMSSLSG
jgi:ribonuclease BN (tRNA processing enzyme)